MEEVSAIHSIHRILNTDIDFSQHSHAKFLAAVNESLHKLCRCSPGRNILISETFFPAAVVNNCATSPEIKLNNSYIQNAGYPSDVTTGASSCATSRQASTHTYTIKKAASDVSIASSDGHLLCLHCIKHIATLFALVNQNLEIQGYLHNYGHHKLNNINYPDLV